MNNLKDRKPSRPDIQEILSRMKKRFSYEDCSDNEDLIKTENLMTTNIVTSTVNEIPVEKSPDDEIAELMLKLNGQVDEELVASIRSRKKMYENQSEVDSTSSITNISDQTELDKPRIILTLRPNENKPDSYVSSSNLTEYSSNSPKKKKTANDVITEVLPLKRSSRRSNDSNQSVLKSAIARKERTFSIDLDNKRLPKKIKKTPNEVSNEDNAIHINTQIPIGDKQKDIKIENEFKEERIEESVTDLKKKKKKFFRGGRYNIFKKKSLQKERQKVKKTIFKQLNAESGNFEVDSSESNSDRGSMSVSSDASTLMSSDRNYQDDLDTSFFTSNGKDKMDSIKIDVQEYNLCLCKEFIRVIIVDEGKITCKAEDCVDGKLIACNRLGHHIDDYGNMPMLRANVALPFLTFCAHHMERFFLHQSCPRCGRFCSEGVFIMCKNKHFSHIGCHQKDKGCLHCGITDVYDLELRRHRIKTKKIKPEKNNIMHITVEVGRIKLTTLDCPPEIDVIELSKELQHLKNEISNPKRTMFSVLGLYEACEKNDVKRVLSILGAECNPMYTFPNNHNRTALHAACYQGNLMLVYLLLQAGVDPNLVDNEMKSPMRIAAKLGYSNIVQYLLNFRGAPEIKDIQGMTSLHLAAKHGQLECCKAILKKQPSMVNWKDNGGWTPLVWACENSHTDVVQFFITHKPNTRVADDEDNVALHWAAISGCLGVVKCLVEYDSEVNMLNGAGDTALHIAARKNATNIVSYLLKKGAMAWHKNTEKKRPIDCCLPNTKCYNLLKNVPLEQRKPVIDVRPLCCIESEFTQSVSEIIEIPVYTKKKPVLISDDITQGCEDVPIRCINEIDDEVPIEFTYIKENCYDVGNYVDSAMSHITSCNCEGACNTSKCKCVQANGECLYDENGRLNTDFDYYNPSVVLYECNWRCKCHKQRCRNRVIQKGIKVKLELYKHKYMDWGVRARHAIPRGTFVCEYVGEIITDQKANDLKEDSYLFNLENPGASELYCIDAYSYSNVSRFINHSCDPNLMSVRSFINHHDKRFPRIAFFAVQDIQENEQLSYDYGTTFWKVKGGLFTCKCGKTNCNFSDEIIKIIHIDSDNEEMELNKTIETKECKFFNNELSNPDLIVSSEVDMSNLANNQTVLSQDNNLMEPKNEFTFDSKNKEPIKSVSKELLKIVDNHSTKILESKLVKNKIDKGYNEKMLNENSVELSEKDQINTGNKVPAKLIQSINNKAVTSYILRPKSSCSNKINTENIKTEDMVLINSGFKSVKLKINRDIDDLSDTPNSNQKIFGKSSDCDELVDIIQIQLVNEKSHTKSSIINGELDATNCSEKMCNSEVEYDKLKSIKA